MSFKIAGISSFLPGSPISNKDLEKLTDTSDEWITTRTGIKQRYFADCSNADLAFSAAKKLLDAQGINPGEIDLVIAATTTPDRAFPSLATTVSGMIGAANIPSFDINAVCSGFIYAMHVASSLMKTNPYKNTLLICSEKMSSVLDMNERSTAVLFGDGAAAILLQPCSNKIFDTIISSDGSFFEALKTEKSSAGKDVISMKGQEVFKNAVLKMTEYSEKILEKNGLSIDDIDFFIPHQANIRIIDAVAEKLGFPKNKVISTVSHHANTSAATIPLAIGELFAKNTPLSGSKVLSCSVGAGFTFGSAIFEI